MHYRLLMVIWPAVVIVTAFSIPASAQTAPTSYTTATRYDAMGRVTGTISPDPDGSGLLTELATRIVYNAAGRVDRVESGTLLSWQPEAVTPANWTGFTAHQTKKTTYDVWGKVLSEAVSGSTGTALTLTQYSYDARGLLECVAVRMNSAVYAALPVSACTQSATGPHGQDRITRKVYDAAGQLLKVQKAVGVVGLEEDYATYTYSLNGKQLSITDARGYKAGFTYDGFDRQVAWTFPSKTTTTATLASCNIGTVTEVLGVTGPSGAYVATDDCEKYFYDRNGNRARFAKRDGSVLAYQYDALNRNTVKTVAERTGLGPTGGNRESLY